MNTNIIQIKKSLQRHFGFEQGTYWNKTLDDFRTDVVDAIENNQFMPIVAPAGAGKNFLYDMAVASVTKNVHFVNVQNYYKEKLDIGSIVNAIIYDIGENESPRRDWEARTRQVTRILGKKVVNDGFHVSVLINDGHRIHANTFMAIKELFEARFNGRGPLLSMIITGQGGLKDKIEKRNDVLWRSNILELNENNGYYTKNQRIAYIKKVFGSAVTPEAASTVAILNKYPLQINFYLENKMEEARKAGKKVIDNEVVKPSNKELYEALKFSLKDIADEAGIGKTTVHDSLHNPNHPQTVPVREAIERLAKKSNGKNNLSKVA